MSSPSKKSKRRQVNKFPHSVIEEEVTIEVKKNKRGKPITSNQKIQVVKLHKKIRKENPRILCKDVVSQLAEETGFGTCSIRKILSQYRRTGTVTSPNKTKRRLTVQEKIDDFDKSVIRRKIYEFYFNKELPKLTKVLYAVNIDKNLPTFKRSTFYLLLKELNFTYTGRDRILTEKEDLIVWRRNYLRNIKRYREEGRQIYYLDETLLNVAGVRSQMDETVRSKKDAILRRVAKPVNQSERDKQLIVLHIGSAAGFVPGGFLCFESTKRTDYVLHDEISGDKFLEWFKTILPLLDDNSVIVMDNAPYHSVKLEKLPNTSWKNTEIIKWLEGKGKEISESMVKAELLQIVALQKERFDKYVVDETAKLNNKTVLRLPPYHFELNPIEMAWSMIKKYIKRNINTSNIQYNVNLLVKQSIDRVTTEHWNNFIKHVRDEEKKMWDVDDISDRMIDRISPITISMKDEDFDEMIDRMKTVSPLRIDVQGVPEYEISDSDY